VLAYSGGAYSNGTVSYGYVKLNTVPVWQASWGGRLPNPRGVNTIFVDPFQCSVQESRRFDTYIDQNAATELSNYLKEVNRGKIIVGVSADEPSNLLANALDTLRDIGADVADVKRRGSFGFVAQKGFPSKTILRKVLTEAESHANPPHFKVTVTGIFCSVAENDTLLPHIVSTKLFSYHYSTIRPILTYHARNCIKPFSPKFSPLPLIS